MKESGLMTLFRQVGPHQAQPCSCLQRRWHDHPRHRQWLQGRLFCALTNMSFSHLRWLYSLRRAIRHKLCWDQQLWAGLWLAYYHQHSNWVSRNIKTKHWLWLSYHDHHLSWLWLQKLEPNWANNSCQYRDTSPQSNAFEKHIFTFPISSIRSNLYWKPYFFSSLAIRSWSLPEELFRPWDRHHPRYRRLCWKQVCLWRPMHLAFLLRDLDSQVMSISFQLRHWRQVRACFRCLHQG